MSGVYLVRPCYDIEAGDDHLAVPYDRFTRLIQSTVATVAVGTLGDTLYAAVLVDTGNGIFGEVGYPDIAVVVDAHPVGGAQL